MFKGIRAFIKKDHEEMPDFFGVEISLIDGKSISLEVVSSSIVQNVAIEFWTHDDYCHLFPIQNIKQIKYDKNFSKIVDIKNKTIRVQQSGDTN